MNSPGQIVRIKCINVLTYKSIEIYPCSQLNLIIGANGSGKSTIISAIILGLGGNPAAVGRAGELSKYVKLGNKKACIEIELFNGDDGNDVIRREFDVENRTRFYLNNKNVSQEKIQKLAEKKYHIQITNLCQILPQEKLELFAKMNDQQRLENTLQTVGSTNLSKFLAELKNSKGKEAEVRKKIETLKHDLNEASNKRENMEAEAKMIKEKQFLIECLRLLKQRRAWQFYFHLKQTSNIIDDVLAEKQTVFKNIATVLKRTEDDMREFGAKFTQARAQAKSANEELLRHTKLVKTKQNSIHATTEEITDIKSSFESTLNKHRTQDTEIRTLKLKIRELQTEADNATQLSGDIERVKANLQEETRKVRQIAHSKGMLTLSLDGKRNELQAVEYRLGKLQDTGEVKMKLLEQYYEDSAKGLRWLDEHRHLFHGQVYGPMFLYVSVNDAANAKYVENCVSNRDLIAFICEHRDDTNTLLRECKEALRLRINVVSAIARVTEDQLRPPMPIDELREFGFHAYVSQFVEAPPIIKNYLVLTARLNEVPVGDQRTFGMADRIPKSLRLYFTDRYRISSSVASLTGQRIESSSDIERARFLQANTNTRDIDELSAQKTEVEAEIADLQMEHDTLVERVQSGDARVRDLNAKLKILQDRQLNQRRVQEQLKQKTRALHQVETSVVDVDLERQKCKLQVRLAMTKVCNMYLELSKMLNELFEAYVRYQRCRLDEKQAGKVHAEKLRVVASFVRQLKQEASSLRKLEPKRRRLTQLAGSLHQWALKFTSGVDPRTPQFKRRKQFFKLTSDIRLLHRLINKFQAKVNCLGSSNNGLEIFLQYKKLTKEVEYLRRKIEKKEQNLSTYKDHLNAIKEQWLTEVQQLIDLINANFRTFFKNMNCAGEIALYKGVDVEDFNGYGIHIKVKFREESDLQILNSMVQSGGERAVSVAIYLLSLQELTTVPFRCIDEINQGMDADNERRIFNLIAQATEEQCQTQYFLLTPKLLPKLHFTPNCKVFCPYNGVGSIPHERISQKIERRSTASTC